MRKSLLLVLALVMLPFPGRTTPSSAAPPGQETDEAIQATIDETWDRFRQLMGADKSAEADELQRNAAAELYAAYLARPGSEIGEKALTSAFMMWGNLGDSERIDQALPQIDVGSEVWSEILHSVENAYAKSQRDPEEYSALLVELERKLTHPMSRSELLLSIAAGHLHAERRDEAKAALQQVIELDAHEFYVKRARGHLYEMASLGIGQPAPDLSAVDLDGNSIELSGLRGRVVLIEFWSTTCGPCLPEIEHHEKNPAAHAGRGLQLIGVALDQKEQDLRRFVAERKMAWPQIHVPDGFDGDLANRFNVWGIPRSYVIDPEGRISAKDLRGESMEQAVRQLLDAMDTAHAG